MQSEMVAFLFCKRIFIDKKAMKYLKEFQNHSQYEAYIASEDKILPNVSRCVQEDDVHYTPFDPCASEKVKTNYEFIDLKLPSGLKWANKNIGALTVTDPGQKFSWGGVKGYTYDQLSGDCKSRRFSWADYEFGDGSASQSAENMTKYNSTDGKTILDAVDDAATVNMGTAWHMPTSNNFNEILKSSNCTKTFVYNYNDSGVNGYLFTSTRNSNTLFIPIAPLFRNGGIGTLFYGLYWCSNVNTSDLSKGVDFSFSSAGTSISGYMRDCGHSIRGVAY
jgi:hypothetical protein